MGAGDVRTGPVMLGVGLWHHTIKINILFRFPNLELILLGNPKNSVPIANQNLIQISVFCILVLHLEFTEKWLHHFKHTHSYGVFCNSTNLLLKGELNPPYQKPPLNACHHLLPPRTWHYRKINPLKNLALKCRAAHWTSRSPSLLLSILSGFNADMKLVGVCAVGPSQELASTVQVVAEPRKGYVAEEDGAWELLCTALYFCDESYPGGPVVWRGCPPHGSSSSAIVAP